VEGSELFSFWPSKKRERKRENEGLEGDDGVTRQNPEKKETPSKNRGNEKFRKPKMKKT